jgi:hypothetical protein
MRPISAAEAIQARLFERILRAEIAEIMHMPPAARAELRDRIEEAEQLIRALRNRFPHDPKIATPSGPGTRPPSDRGPRALLR